MNIEERCKGEITILRFSGRITYGRGDLRIRNAFEDLLREGRRYFVVELDDVPYMDSSAIGELVASQDRARKVGGSIRLVPNEQVRRLFDVYELHRLFRIFPDVEDALASFAAPRLEPVH